MQIQLNQLNDHTQLCQQFLVDRHFIDLFKILMYIRRLLI